MTKGQKAKQDFVRKLGEVSGVSPDSYGNFKWNVNVKGVEKTYRVKPMKQVWRLERKITKSWIKISGGKFTPEIADYLGKRINDTKEK